jgi:branched-chain amino acid aminotransferase
VLRHQHEPQPKETIAMTIFPTSDDPIPFKPRFLWRSGELVAWDAATIHVTSIGHASVSSVFEGIKAYWNADEEELFVFRLEEHIDRFLDSIRLVRLRNRFSRDEIIEAVLTLLRANETRADVYIRPWIYATGLVREMMMPPDNDAELVIDTWWFNSRMLTERACTAMITSWARIDESSMPPRIKAFSNYHNGRLGIIEARTRGADWPIFLNRNYKVTEGPASCIGMIKRGVFYTPPLTSGILDSITRSTFLTLIPEMLGIPVVERDIDRTELYLADELFFLGTGWEVLPIGEVDGMKIGDGSMGRYTRQLDRAYHDLVRGKTASHPEWRRALYDESRGSELRRVAAWNPKRG